MDVVTAFLNAEVETDIYMAEPQGIGTIAIDGTRLVCHLKKALYGIREAPKDLNAHLTSWLVSYGSPQSLVDPGVFVIFIEKTHLRHGCIRRRLHPHMRVRKVLRRFQDCILREIRD